MIHILLRLLIFVSFIGTAAGASLPFESKVIQSGHSLTDPIPWVLERMIKEASGKDAVIAKSTVPGSPMDWRWNNAPGYGAPDARKNIGNYDVLVITERAPLSGTMPWHNSEAEALRWVNHAWNNGNGGLGALVYLYATWVPINSGPHSENPHNDPEAHIPFRDRLPLEWERWERIADYVNANRTLETPSMKVIPGPLVLAKVYDDIASGNAPGLSNIADLFFDDIHLNDSGAYLITLAHFVSLYGTDPRGLSNDLGQTKPPSAETAAWMQELVWQVISEYKGK